MPDLATLASLTNLKHVDLIYTNIDQGPLAGLTGLTVYRGPWQSGQADSRNLKSQYT